MSSWATVADARDDLRNYLNDGPEDKLRHRQSVFGRLNGANVIFKTLDRRRITDFSTNVNARLGAFVDGVQVATSSDDTEIGEFTLAVAPTEGQELEASFYVQWFNDGELDRFLERSAQFLECSADPTVISEGLQPSAIQFAASQAYQKLAGRPEFLAATYRLEDRPSGQIPITYADHFSKMADRLLKQARTLRDEFYKDRKGKAKAPLFANNLGVLRANVPRR